MNDSAFIHFLYELLLHRRADPEGLAYWKEQLHSGKTAMQVFTAIQTSPECESKQSKKWLELETSMPGESLPFYFAHIPKTAGMSVHAFLASVFPPHDIFPGWLCDHLKSTSVSRLRQYRLFRGHFFGYLQLLLGSRLRMFTVLRDPVDRSISHYYHIRRASEHPFHQLVAQMSLREFCLHAETRHLVENFQACFLASLAPLKDLGGSEGDGVSAQTCIEQLSAQNRKPEWLLDAATVALGSFEAVGTTENLDDALIVFSRLLGCDAPPAAYRINSAPERIAAKDIDAETLAIIDELTIVDRHLHTQAAKNCASLHPQTFHGALPLSHNASS